MKKEESEDMMKMLNVNSVVAEVGSEDPVCKEVNGDLARWTVMKILEHNPHFSKRK